MEINLWFLLNHRASPSSKCSSFFNPKTFSFGIDNRIRVTEREIERSASGHFYLRNSCDYNKYSKETSTFQSYKLICFRRLGIIRPKKNFVDLK